MGFWDDITGQTAADASRAAAADTYAKQTSAARGIQDYGKTYPQNFQPWIGTGTQANGALAQLINNPNSITTMPGYQFGLDQGAKAIDHSALAGGSLFSGKTGKDLQKFGTNYADQMYGNQFDRLLRASTQGLAANQYGYGGQLDANKSAYQGLFGSAGTIGQGDIAAAQSQQRGTQNLLSLGGSLLGSALGGPLGGSLGSLMGGGGASYGGNGIYGGSSSNPLAGLSAADYGFGF